MRLRVARKDTGSGIRSFGHGTTTHSSRVLTRLRPPRALRGRRRSRPHMMTTAPSGSTSSAPSRERSRDARSRHSIAGATRPAGHGSARPSWDNSLAGCSPSSDRHRSALSATRSPSEVPRSSASSNLWASACCGPLYWTAPRWAWTPETSGRRPCCPEVARAAGSAAETVMGKGRQAPIVAAAAEAVEAGNPSGPPPATRPRAGPSRRASRLLSSFVSKHRVHLSSGIARN